MRIADIKENDTANGKGICVSLWVQGCSHHCFNCHNPETWDYDGGATVEVDELIDILITMMNRNKIKRNLSILGGEPLDPKNISDVIKIINSIKEIFPDRKIFLWTGYEYDKLSPSIKMMLKNVDVIIDGAYEDDKRDVTLELRGSTNQRVLYKGIDF